MNESKSVSQSGNSRSTFDSGAPSLEVVRENVNKIMNASPVSLDAIVKASPESCDISEVQQAQSFIVTHFDEGDLVNIVTAVFTDDDGKTRPFGPGQTHPRDVWIKYIETDGVPQNAAGVWVRKNAVSPKGSGKGGAFRDVDVVRHRNLLLECDNLTIEEQVTLFARLKLPLVSMVTSGGRSVHALVRLDAPSLEEFKQNAKKLLFRLRVFGIDRSNSNPSRMTRLPGGVRKLGGVGEGKQRLLYLNPNPEIAPIISNK